MPLSKQRNRDRMRQARLHTRVDTDPVQPNEPTDSAEVNDIPPEIEYVDAEGYPVYSE